MLKYILFVWNYTIQNILKRRIKPRVLQLPITGKCNSRCCTCNIWKDKSEKVNIDAIELKRSLSDPFFSEISLVGINGGEPSLYPDIANVLEALWVLRKLKRVHFISNAMISYRLLSMMDQVKSECSKRGIKVYLTISIDGVGELHNQVRGIPTAFKKTMETLEIIRQHSEKYCDVLDIGCTLSVKNVAHAIEIETFLDSLSISAYYHPAVPNRRLHNYENQDFSIMNYDRSRMLATEYFWGKFKYGHGLRTRGRAFLTYYYLLNKGKRRLAGCNYLRSDVTIDEHLNLFLCATASHKVGDLKKYSATELLKMGALKNEEQMLKKQCDSCVHYIVFPSFKGAFLFIEELLKPFIWIKYKVLATWLRLL